MIPCSLQKLAEIVNATLILPKVQAGSTPLADRQIVDVSIDSRKKNHDSLFVALKGERFDGHDFVRDAVAAGAVALLVNRHLNTDVPELIVKDTCVALGQLAFWVRQQVSARTVALTGSSGKTSVKEMTAAILGQCGNVLYTRGNFNNAIGVPLTLLRLTPENDFAVIELGTSHMNEIAYTVDLTRPQTVLVNNLSAAHLQGLGSLEGVAKAKGEIFTGLTPEGIAVINADSHDLPRWQPTIGNRKIWRFSLQQAAGSDFFASDVVPGYKGTHFMLHTPFGQAPVSLPLPGLHNVANALAATALAMSVGATLAEVQQGLAALQALPGRLFPLQLAQGKLLLDDSYNANVGSMTAAARVLATMPGYRVMAVGDMAELGDEAEDCHRQVGEAIRLAGIDKVLSVGLFSEQLSGASGYGEHFVDQAAMVARLSALLSEHKTITILVKGSRSAAMENVVRKLQETALC